MNNKIALVNKDLHNKLFEKQEDKEVDQPQKIYRRHPLPPQIMLKNMIKKGLTNTQTNILSRPKTANSTFTRTQQPRNSVSQVRTGDASSIRKGLSVRKNVTDYESHGDFNTSVQHPQQFQEFAHILNKIKVDRDLEGVRRRVKLQKYGQRKFIYAWKKYNIPN